MADPKETERWHLKKEIQLGHLITTFVVAISAVLYINKIEQRLSVVETQVLSQRESAALLRQQLERMDAKLDRLIERDRK
jgi:nucleoside permease NupC